jgi:hypothetical protein
VFSRSIQLLACEFEVSTDAEPVVHWLDRVRASAVQDHPVSRRHRFDVRREADGYRVREDGEDRGVVESAAAAGALVEGRLHGLAFGALADCTKVHAGCATWRSRRFLVVGAGRAGKTTLMTRLLFEGFGVEGDEMVILRDGRAVPYPRRFGIRRRTLALVPEVATLVPHVRPARVDERDGYHILALDPAELGVPWRIGSGPVDAVFVLDGRHDAGTRVSVCPDHVMIQRMMAQSTPPGGGRGTWVRDICAVVRGAACYILVVGDLDSAVSTLRNRLESVTKR